MSIPRSNTVQELLLQDDTKISFNEVFKTRNKVIDDRSISRLTNTHDSNTSSRVSSRPVSPIKHSTNVIHTNNPIELSPKKVAWDHPDRLSSVPSNIPSDAEDSLVILQSSSEIFALPDIEAKLLEQYKIDTNNLTQLNSKVDSLARKIKVIRAYIKERMEEERELYLPHIIKIQAWFRGIRTRRSLGLPATPSSKVKDTPKTNNAAKVIQSAWYISFKQARLSHEASIGLFQE